MLLDAIDVGVTWIIELNESQLITEYLMRIDDINNLSLKLSLYTIKIRLFNLFFCIFYSIMSYFMNF